MAIISLIVVLFILMFLRVPIGFALAGASAFFIIFVKDAPMMLNLLSQAVVVTADSFSLLAIPFFMLVGSLMSRSGQAREIIALAEALTGGVAGGLGAAGIAACMIFAAISGSGPAVVAALGGFLIPAMTSRGYSPAYSGALMAAGATIGPVIPPSIPMIVYGVSAGTSVIAMFIGGVVPGLMMGLGLIMVNWFISRRRGYQGLPQEKGWRDLCRAIWDAKLALFLPVIILGGIYGGLFTPTEAAVVGSVYALLIGVFVYRSLNLTGIRAAMIEAGLLSAVVMFILGGSTTFSRLLMMERIPTIIAASMLEVFSSPLIIMLVILVFLLVGGMFLDTISCIVLFTPLFLPIVKQLGYHPVFFGVLMTVNLCIGFITPPVGVNLYVAQSISKANFSKLVAEVIPFIAILMIVMLVILVFPEIVLILPRLLGAM